MPLMHRGLAVAAAVAQLVAAVHRADREAAAVEEVPPAIPEIPVTQARRQIQLPSTLCQWSADLLILLPLPLVVKLTSRGTRNK